MHECILKAHHPESENHKSKSIDNSKGRNWIIGTGRSTTGHGGNAIVKRWPLSWLRNDTKDGAVRTWRGKEFQSDGAAISNEQLKWLLDLWVLLT